MTVAARYLSPSPALQFGRRIDRIWIGFFGSLAFLAMLALGHFVAKLMFGTVLISPLVLYLPVQLIAIVMALLKGRGRLMIGLLLFLLLPPGLYLLAGVIYRLQ